MVSILSTVELDEAHGLVENRNLGPGFSLRLVRDWVSLREPV
jgi:hypothetical protein